MRVRYALLMGSNIELTRSAPEIRSLIEGTDWAKTAIGAKESWPEGLKAVVDLIEGCPLAMVVLWGPELVQIYNAAYAVIMGAKHPGGMGMRTKECWPEVWHINEPIYQRVWHGESVTFTNQLYPLARNGQVEDTYLTLAYSPLRNGGEAVAGVLVTLVETTEQVKAEGKLRTSEERLRLALDSAQGIGTWDWDVQKNVVFADEGFCAVYGVDPEAGARGLPIVEFTRRMHPDDQPGVHRAIERSVATGEEFTEEYRLQQNDGSERWVLARGRCRRDANGKPARFPGVTTDITRRKQTEAALEEGQQRFRALVEASAQVVWTALPDGRIEEESPSWTAYTGQSYAEWRGHGWLDAIYPEDRAGAAERWKVAVEGRTLYESDYRLWHAGSKTYRWTTARGVPLMHADGGIRLWVGMNMDIQERRLTEDALEHERNLFKTVLENAPVGIVVAEPSGRIVLGNKAMEAIFRHPVMPTADIESHGDWIAFHADGRRVQGSEYPLGRTLIDGKAHAGEFLYQRGDGTKAWVRINSAPILDRTGGLSGGIVAILDIDEEKRAADALQESELKYRFLTEALPQLIWMARVSNEGSIVLEFVNREMRELTGRTLEQLQQNGWVNLVHPEDLEPMLTKLRHSLGSGEPLEDEFRLLGSDGAWHWLFVRSERFSSERDEGFWLGTATDITHRKQAEETIQSVNTELEKRVFQRTQALESSNKELEAFSYSVSHDLRAPLRTIDGFSAALEEDYAEVLGDDGRDLLRRVRGAANRMGELIDALLKLSRVTRAELEETDVNVSALAQTIAAELQGATPGRNLEFRIAPELWVKGDPRLLRIALENLLDNAVKYTGPVAAAVIEVGEEPGDERRIYVRDNGVGFDMRYVGKLFGAFQRLHGDKDFKGSGIGLATVQRIVARHGGRMSAEGTPGAGATFRMHFGVAD